jgi:hypothetical protein
MHYQIYGQVTVKDSIEIQIPQKIHNTHNKSLMKINSVWESSQYYFDNNCYGEIHEQKFKYTLDDNYLTINHTSVLSHKSLDL